MKSPKVIESAFFEVTNETDGKFRKFKITDENNNELDEDFHGIIIMKDGEAILGIRSKKGIPELFTYRNDQFVYDEENPNKYAMFLNIVKMEDIQ